MSDELLYAFGQADAHMYLCSEELRPSKNSFYNLYFIMKYDSFKSFFFFI